jgi:hypothetical protein
MYTIRRWYLKHIHRYGKTSRSRSFAINLAQLQVWHILASHICRQNLNSNVALGFGVSAEPNKVLSAISKLMNDAITLVFADGLVDVHRTEPTFDVVVQTLNSSPFDKIASCGSTVTCVGLPGSGPAELATALMNKGHCHL